MSILCTMFGHKPLTKDGANYVGGARYARMARFTVDGIDQLHMFLMAECPRCGVEYPICNVHGPSRQELKKAGAA